MTKNSTLLLLVLIFSFSTKAQQFQFEGKIVDTTTGKPVKNAVVLVMSAKDSVMRAFARTNTDGRFIIKDLKTGNVILSVTHPLFADYIDNINLTGTSTLPPIPLTSKSKVLETIFVKSGGSIRIKGDTTIYTADSFNVSANANVEELLKKLPGIQVDKNGEIKAMGEKVEKVLVDGEEFFGDDPGMAVKNLRADAVKEVQVFDKKSDQAAFTGIDDGNTKKTINLKLKDDRKHGYFGKISLSGGPARPVDNRFNNNLMYGSFRGQRKFSAYVLNGNTGQDGLSWQERQKYGGDDNNFEMMDEDGIFSFNFQNGGSDEEVFINPENGLMRNLNAGVQYSNKWNDKTKLNFTPKYNLQDYTNEKTATTITQVGDTSLTEKSTTITNVDRYNLKNKAVVDWNIDSANSLKLTVNADYYHSESEESTISSTFGSSGVKINNVTRDNRRNSDKNVLGNTLLLKHKFKKARRTLSLNTDWSMVNSTGNQYLNSLNNVFFNTDSISFAIDQYTKTTNNSSRISSKLVYTEPLTKKWSMELSYQFSFNRAINIQESYKPSSANVYDEFLDSFSNNFKQNIIVHTPQARLNYAFKKYKFNFGSGFAITKFDFLNRSSNTPFNRNFINILPSASFVYQYKSNHSLRFKYNGSTTQPTINQLQPLRNNLNLFNQFVGNPDLKPSFVSNINITHNGYNFLKEMWNFQSLNINFTENSITNNRTIDKASGATVTKPINTNGNVVATLWTGIGMKIKKLDLSFNINPNVTYTRFADVINSQVSYSKTTAGGISVNFQKSKANKYEFTLSNTYDYSYNTNTQTAGSNRFTNNTLIFSSTVYYKKTWSFISEYQYYARMKIAGQLDNLDAHLVNLQLQKTFKNNEFTVYVKVRDLLNQNIGIDRSFYANIFSEERNQRLRRYFMLGFAWDFKNKSTAKK